MQKNSENAHELSKSWVLNYTYTCVNEITHRVFAIYINPAVKEALHLRHFTALWSFY